MTFKKKKIINSGEEKKLFSVILWVISILIIFCIGLFTINNLDKIQFDFYPENPKDIKTSSWAIETTVSSEIKIKENIKNKDKINVLLIGRWWWNHDAPNLTDSIILLSIDKKESIITMLSIPRDLYVKYPDWKLWYTTFILRKWSWVLDWDVALKYVRSRHSVQASIFYILNTIIYSLLFLASSFFLDLWYLSWFFCLLL